MTLLSVERDLRPLFDPRSVAVVGASENPRKWGNWLAVRALRGEHRRTVSLINRAGGEILGRRAHRSLLVLPDAPELVAVVVPEMALEATIGEALEIGARAIVAITAGTAGDARDAMLAERVRAAGAVLVGPNCLGVFDAAAQLDLVSNDLPSGSVGLLSQSGNLALDIGLLAGQAGLGFSRFVSLGNQADLDAATLIEALAEHEETAAIALYIEDFRDGRAFARAAAAARERGKPVVLLTLGQSEATARAARSHTGALASDEAAIAAACRAAGVERVRTPAELVDVVQGLVRAVPPRGRRVAVLADGGGHGGIAASLASAEGLVLPELSAETEVALQATLPATAACSNPIDLAGGGEEDLGNYQRAAEVLLSCPEVDAVLMTGYFGGYDEYGEAFGDREVRVAQALGRAAAETGRTLIVQTMHPQTAAGDALRRGGVATYRSIEHAVDLLRRLAEHSDQDRRPIPTLPPPGGPIQAEDYVSVRELLAGGGLPFVAQRTVHRLEDAHAAAAEIGYPVVLKALGLLHKSDAGGVAIGLSDPGSLAEAWQRMHERLEPESCSVEAMAPLSDGVELLIGTRWDARFGPIAVAGLGGVYTEVLADVAVGLAPLGAGEARSLLRRLRGWPLLSGARGRPRLDVDAAATALAAISHLAAEHPEIAELEINPLLVLPRGAAALDARAVLASKARTARNPLPVPGRLNPAGPDGNPTD